MKNRLHLENLVIAAREVDRRKAEDPIFTWEPNEKQKPFIKSVLNQESRENWFVCANRAGKSDAGAFVGSYLARFGFKDPKPINCGDGIEVKDRATSGWVVGLDYPMLRDTTQPKYIDNGFVPPDQHPPFIPQSEIKEYRAGDQIVKLKSGSIIGFKSCDSGRSKFQGAEKDWVHFDEEPDKNVFDETTIRVGSNPLTIFGTCTLLPPEGAKGGVTWVYQEVLVPYMSGNAPDVAAFSASIYDNPHISTTEIEKLERKFPLHSNIGKIRLLGEWLPGLSGARAYSNFNHQIHVEDTSPFFRSRVPLIWTWDFNVSPMCTIVMQYIDGLFVVHKELVIEETNIYEMCDAFRKAYPTHHSHVLLRGDSTGTNRSHQTGRSSYQIISAAMRDYPVPMKMQIPEANPLVEDRVNAVQYALLNEQGEAGMLIDPSCQELILDMQGVLLDKLGKIKKVNNRNDPYYRRSHTSDAMGYGVFYEAPVVSQISKPYELGDIPTPGYF